jgi:prefoldin subunit 5
MSYLKVKDNNKLLRDVNTNAIVNVDLVSYEAYKARYENKYKEIRKMKDYESQLTELKGEIDEIKNMLSQIVNKLP